MMRPPLRHRKAQGFTLVEMIVATLLLAIGVTACLGAIGVSIRATSIAKDYQTATLLADRHFSELESDPTTITPGEQSGDFGDEYRGFTWVQSIEQADVDGLFRVQVTIEWTDGTSQKSALFTTYEPEPETSTPSS